eukprot:TRINITY_DN6809_c0_g1_i2.p1 TRINITY_DN6809_c0_g1~~TRINITY_DN6809_c0_g1_i2.p1  ORF type:complete len:187 (+),score=21.82 TRINITY_DN6809_c0_g1_i2:446-1006(+)
MYIHQRKYRCLVNVPLYIFLILILVLAYTLPIGNLRIVYCYGYLTSGLVSWPVRKILNISYISTLSVISLCVGVMLLFSWSRLEATLHKADRSRGRQRSNHLFWLSFVYGTSFVIQTGLLLGFSIPGVTIIELRVILLLVIEMIGPLVTLYSMYTSQIKKTGASTSGNLSGNPNGNRTRTKGGSTA